MDQQQRLELLSAYIDGEVTAEEKQQVEEWLSQDPQAQQTYQSLQKLRFGLRDLSPPKPTSQTEALTDFVITQSHRKTLKYSLIGAGGAIAAILVTAFWIIVPGSNSPIYRLAESNQSEESSEALMIAVNQPLTESLELTASNSDASIFSLHQSLKEPYEVTTVNADSLRFSFNQSIKESSKDLMRAIDEAITKPDEVTTASLDSFQFPFNQQESSKGLMMAIDKAITESYDVTTASADSLQLPLNRPLVEIPEESRTVSS